MKSKILCVGLISGFLLIGMSHLLSQELLLAQASRLGKIRATGRINVGMNIGYIPFEFKNERGEIVGFDVDIAKELAKSLGVELVIKEYKWEDLIPNLGGDIDVIISGMTRTLDRAILVNFTEPYFQTGQVVIVTERNIGINDWKELNNPKKKVVMVEGTTSQEVVEKKLPNAKIIGASNEQEAVKILLSNEADAFVFDKPFVDSFVCIHPKMKILPTPLSYEFYSFAVPKDDPDFLLWLNYFIGELKISGRYEEIYDKWFKDICK